MNIDGFSKEAMQAALAGLGIGDIGTYTVALLPDPGVYDRRTCWCSDLHDGIGGRLVAESGFWKPIRPLALFTQANSNQNMTLFPLLNSPTQIMPSTLTLTRTLTIDTSHAYPGQRFRIKRSGGGLFNLVVNSVGLALNTWADFEFDPAANAFVQTAGSGLL